VTHEDEHQRKALDSRGRIGPVVESSILLDVESSILLDVESSILLDVKEL
jgi:hypothetical protein